MQVIIPAYKEDNSRIVFKPTKGAESILDKYKTNKEECFALKNKAPLWSSGRDRSIVYGCGTLLLLTEFRNEILHSQLSGSCETSFSEEFPIDQRR